MRPVTELSNEISGKGIAILPVVINYNDEIRFSVLISNFRILVHRQLPISCTKPSAVQNQDEQNNAEDNHRENNRYPKLKNQL